MNILSIFSESHYSFDGKREGETVLLVLRRHPFFLLTQILLSVVLLLAPALFMNLFAGSISTNGLTHPLLFLYSMWTLILWQGIFYSITMYTLDIWIVTDQRIIDSTQHGFFSRNVSELNLSRIQDISVKIIGPIQTFLGFGNLEIQTAGTEEKFKFIQIPNPEEVKNEIMSKISHSSTEA